MCIANRLIKENVKMLLNTKSIIECDEYEEVIHNKEIEMIENEICKLPI